MKKLTRKRRRKENRKREVILIENDTNEWKQTRNEKEEKWKGKKE